jgi:MFS family permease
VAFVAIERTHPQPMLPLELFRSRQFTGANLTTLAVYAGLGASTFLLVLELQIAMHYSALAAGLSLLPLTVLMLTLSARFGALSQRTGPRLPMTVGPLVVAAGLVMLALVHPGDHYVSTILPAAIVFGLGLSATVAPLTAAVLASIDEDHVGVGSAVNNAVARVAGLLAVAALPAIVGLRTDSAAALTSGYRSAMLIGAGMSAAGGVIAFFTIRRSVAVRHVLQPAMVHCCNSPELAREEGAA